MRLFQRLLAALAIFTASIAVSPVSAPAQTVLDDCSIGFQCSVTTGSIPPELGNITNPNLRKLTINGDSLTGSIPPELGNLTNMWELRIEGDSLTGSIPPELGNLTNLRKLTINGDSLTGSIPPELGNLTNMWELRIEGDSFTGSIPPELGNFNGLWKLIIEGDSFTGSIPPELGNISRLTAYRPADNITGLWPAGEFFGFYTAGIRQTQRPELPGPGR